MAASEMIDKMIHFIKYVSGMGELIGFLSELVVVA